MKKLIKYVLGLFIISLCILNSNSALASYKYFYADSSSDVDYVVFDDNLYTWSEGDTVDIYVYMKSYVKKDDFTAKVYMYSLANTDYSIEYNLDYDEQYNIFYGNCVIPDNAPDGLFEMGLVELKTSGSDYQYKYVSPSFKFEVKTSGFSGSGYDEGKGPTVSSIESNQTLTTLKPGDTIDISISMTHKDEIDEDVTVIFENNGKTYEIKESMYHPYNNGIYKFSFDVPYDVTGGYLTITSVKVSDYKGNLTIVNAYLNFKIGCDSIEFVKDEIDIAAEQCDTVNIKGSYDTEDIIWTSSNPKVAEVDEYGNVFAYKYGQTIITATSRLSNVSATCKVNVKFYDVAGSGIKGNANYQYYYAPVYWAAENGITTGYDGEYFGVGEDCTRASVMIFLWRIAGSPKPKNNASKYFNDTSYYSASSATNKAIAWAYEKGISKGYSDGSFGVTDSITRKDVLIMLYRLAGKPKVSGSMKFSDCKSYKKGTDTYNAIIWGSSKGITAGYSDGRFKPTDNCLREQIITFLYRYKNN